MRRLLSLLSLLLAMAALAAALALAAHHPLAPAWAVAAVLLASAGMAVFAQAWLVALPALLPWLGWAPWTGWITIEETDLLVLAVLAGGYARLAWRAGDAPRAGQPGQPGATLGPKILAGLLLAAWVPSVALGVWRGVADAGGLVLDWYQAYRGPMNSLRLAKPTLAVLLLLPLWWRALSQDSATASRRLTLGMAACQAGIALVCVWERVLYPGLLNFSTDYRSTGPFWEMHVGGAPLDGMLALTLPFVLLAWLGARTRLGWLLASGTVLLGAYALLTTFSRILLLAAPLALAATLLVWWRQAPGAAPWARVGVAAGPAAARAPGPGGRATPVALAWGLWAGVSLAAAGMFPTSGYRGLLALLGNAGVLLVLAPVAHGLQRREWAAAVALALAAGPPLLAAAAWLPKGPYGLQLLMWAVALALLARWRHSRAGLALAVAAWLIALAGMVLLAGYWGGGSALAAAALAALALLLALLLLAARRLPPWPEQWRWQGRVWVAMVGSAAVVGVFAGGAFMTGRLDTLEADRAGRLRHFRQGLSLLPDRQAWWLGLGLGRYADAYAIAAGPGHRPGDLRWAEADGQRVMRIAPGTHMMGFGELLRLSQRIARPTRPVTLRITLRSTVPAQLHAEVCLKHLLYSQGCQIVSFSVKPGAQDWQTLSVLLAGDPLPSDALARARFAVFSLAVESASQPVEVKALSLRDAQGHEHLRNGGFEQGGARWFFSSDMNHLPWHAKNVLVHLLVEQGWLGLAALGLLSACALWRVGLGAARGHALAPALAGALVGVWTVGAVDSLLDLPRLALTMLLVTVIALSLPAGGRVRGPVRGPPAG